MNSLKLKSWALAVGIAITSLSAAAAPTVELRTGTPPGETVYDFESNGTNAFFDDFIPVSALGSFNHVDGYAGGLANNFDSTISFDKFNLVDAAHNVVISGFTGNFFPSISFGFIKGESNIGDYFVNVKGSSTGYASYGGSLSFTNVSAVPEPETYAMMLAGLSLIGFAARRRKNG